MNRIFYDTLQYELGGSDTSLTPSSPSGRGYACNLNFPEEFGLLSTTTFPRAQDVQLFGSWYFQVTSVSEELTTMYAVFCCQSI